MVLAALLPTFLCFTFALSLSLNLKNDVFSPNAPVTVIWSSNSDSDPESFMLALQAEQDDGSGIAIAEQDINRNGGKSAEVVMTVGSPGLYNIDAIVQNDLIVWVTFTASSAVATSQSQTHSTTPTAPLSSSEKTSRTITTATTNPSSVAPNTNTGSQTSVQLAQSRDSSTADLPSATNTTISKMDSQTSTFSMSQMTSSSTVSTGLSSSTASSSQVDPQNKRSVIPIVAGVISGFLLLASCLAYTVYRRRRRRQSVAVTNFEPFTPPITSEHASQDQNTPSELASSTQMSQKQYNGPMPSPVVHEQQVQIGEQISNIVHRIATGTDAALSHRRVIDGQLIDELERWTRRYESNTRSPNEPERGSSPVYPARDTIAVSVFQAGTEPPPYPFHEVESFSHSS